MTSKRSRRVSLEDLLAIPATLDLVTGEVDLEVSCEFEVTRTVGDLAALGVYDVAEHLSESAFIAPITRLYRLINDAEVRRIQGLKANETGGVKFDVTVVQSTTNIHTTWDNSWEWPKTSGHFHLPVPGMSLASPGFYQVIWGKGLIALHSIDGKSVEAGIVEVNAGDTVLIPPDKAHISINTGREPLVFANVCVRAPHLNYKDVHRYGGGPYLFSPGGVAENPGYEAAGLEVSPLQALAPNQAALVRFGIDNRSISQFIGDERVTHMLTHPDGYGELFEAALVSRDQD